MNRLWAMAMMLAAWRLTAGVARESHPGLVQTSQMNGRGGGAAASPPVFVRGIAAPTGRGVAAASHEPFAPALVRLAFAGWAW